MVVTTLSWNGISGLPSCPHIRPRALPHHPPEPHLAWEVSESLSAFDLLLVFTLDAQ